MIVGFSLGSLGGLEYAPKAQDSSTMGWKPPRCTHWSGRRFHHSGVLPNPRQGLLDQGHGLSSRTQMAMGIRREGEDLTVFSVELANNGADGPCRKQASSDLRLWQPPSDGGVPESTTIGPIGEAIVPESAVREGAAFVRSITPVDWSITSGFSALVTVPEPIIGNCGPLIAL